MTTNVQNEISPSNLSRDELLALVAKQGQEIYFLNQELSQLKFALYSRLKERAIVTPDPSPLFDEVESLVQVPLVEESKDHIHESTDKTGSPKRIRGKRKPLPTDLPRIREEFDLAESERICPEHGSPLEKFGEKKTEKLSITPAKILVVEQVRFSYKCPCCSSDGNERIVTAKKSPEIVPGGLATPELMATIATDKYLNHLPLHRLEQIFKRIDVKMSRTTMARWMIACSKAAQPLINLMREDILEGDVAQCDETVVQVLNEPQRTPEQNSYMWLLARRHIAPILLFQYYESRGRAAALDLLSEFKGTLLTDALKTYDSVARSEKFQLAACWAHSRRRFFFAEKAEKKASKAKTADMLAASLALQYIRKLYAIEKKTEQLLPEERQRIRKAEAEPILDQFYNWLCDNEGQFLPKSLMGKAISYTMDQWPKLIRYIENGRIPIDNNYAEAHIRHFVIGRNNWVFSSTPDGAHASAALYSLIETAKANKICPLDYLTIVFKELPKTTDIEGYQKLLPYNISKHFPVKNLT